MTNAHGLNLIIQETVEKNICRSAKIIAIEPQSIKLGFQSQEVQRYKITLQINKLMCEVFLVTKKAELNERRVLNLLQSQSAKIPFNYSNDIITDSPSYICMQDIDHNTDYNKIDLESVDKKITDALAHIHASNYRLDEELIWLPFANRTYISRMLEKWWIPHWESAKRTEEFVEEFSAFIPEIEAVSASIIDDMEHVINDESSHTLVHTDLHPGNVLCSRDNEVFFIDWADAHYGSFYFDIPLRFSNLEKAEIYRETLLEVYKIDIPSTRFAQQFRIASRYSGIRYIAWTFGDWKNSPNTLQSLKNYLNMIVN